MLPSIISAMLHVVQSESEVQISRETLTRWAETCLRMNHLGTLIEREMEGKDGCERAIDLAERARKRAWNLFNELVEYGAKKPENYAEPARSKRCSQQAVSGYSDGLVALAHTKGARCPHLKQHVAFWAAFR